MNTILNDLPWLQYKFANVEIWLWLVLPLLFIGSYLFARLLLSLFIFAASLIKFINRNWLHRYIFSIIDALALLFAAMFFSGAQKLLPLPDSVLARLANFNSTLYALAIAWILIVYINHTGTAMRRRFMDKGKQGASALIPLFRKIANAAVIVLALLFLMQNWGFDVAALIAALGIGGIAVALASQKSVESLFGGIIISLDQPIRVGETGKFGDMTGIVEDIGLRSTRIRTDQRTLYYIPNADMAAMRIENISVRDKLLFQRVVGLGHETTPEQIEKIVTGIRALLKSHKMLETAAARSHFVNLGAASIDIEIVAYVNTNVWDDFLKVQEELLLGIMRIIEQAGAKLAIPPVKN
jgi:MscS family membrane protein